MKIEVILAHWIMPCFLITQLWTKTFSQTSPHRSECGRIGVFKKKHEDSSLQNSIIQTIDVSHVTMCLTACMDHAQCKSYNFQETEDAVKSCELSSSTATASSNDLTPRQGYSYYEFQDPCSDIKGAMPVYKCSTLKCQVLGSRCTCNSGYTGNGFTCDGPFPTSCQMTKDLGLSIGDGEYNLYLLYPDCLKSARVYCADMDTDHNPWEYVTLSAGRDTNYGMDKRLYWGNEPWRNTKTAFDKIRLKVPSREIAINDSRFSVQIEGIIFMEYGKAAGCQWAANCENYQKHKWGKTEADLTGTDFKFPAVIPYQVSAHPICAANMVEPTMSKDLKKWSVRCDGHCGACWPEVLTLSVDGC